MSQPDSPALSRNSAKGRLSFNAKSHFAMASRSDTALPGSTEMSGGAVLSPLPVTCSASDIEDHGVIAARSPRVVRTWARPPAWEPSQRITRIWRNRASQIRDVDLQDGAESNLAVEQRHQHDLHARGNVVERAGALHIGR